MEEEGGECCGFLTFLVYLILCTLHDSWQENAFNNIMLCCECFVHELICILHKRAWDNFIFGSGL